MRHISPLILTLSLLLCCKPEEKAVPKPEEPDYGPVASIEYLNKNKESLNSH